MSETAKNSSSGGIGFCGLLTIVFITLKLCHVIEWSWVWVLSPLWIPGAITITIIFALFVLYVIANMKSNRHY